MNSLQAIAATAKTGIWGLDDILAGGFGRGQHEGAASHGWAPGQAS
jgi:hypothetical protein